MAQQIIRPVQAYLQLSDTTNQVPADTSELQIGFNTVDLQKNMTFANDTITIVRSGRYMLIAGAQVGKDSGSVQRDIDMWAKVNDVDVPRSSVRSGLTNTEHAVLIVNLILDLRAADTVKLYTAVSNTTGDIGLYAFTPAVGPVVPSIIFSMYLI